MYGNDAARARALRDFEGGKLRVTEDRGLPLNTCGLPQDDPVNWTGAPLRATGDARGNASPLLLAYHTLFVREHNRYCEALGGRHPEWGDETLYQEARRRVVAHLQHITYRSVRALLEAEGAIGAVPGGCRAVTGGVKAVGGRWLLAVGNAMGGWCWGMGMPLGESQCSGEGGGGYPPPFQAIPSVARHSSPDARPSLFPCASHEAQPERCTCGGSLPPSEHRGQAIAGGPPCGGGRGAGAGLVPPTLTHPPTLEYLSSDET